MQPSFLSVIDSLFGMRLTEALIVGSDRRLLYVHGMKLGVTMTLHIIESYLLSCSG